MYVSTSVPDTSAHRVMRPAPSNVWVFPSAAVYTNPPPPAASVPGSPGGSVYPLPASG